MKVGVQIYSLRKHLTDDKGVAKVFDYLNSVGSEVVELATMPKMTADSIADISRASNVAVVSTHSSFDDIVNNLDALIAEHKAYGAEYIGIGSIPPKYLFTKRSVRKFCKLFNIAQEKAEKHGLNMIYHNHAFEFLKFRKKKIYDIMLEEFSPNVKMCLDCYWAYAGGQNVEELIAKIGNRLAILHCKDLPNGGKVNGYRMCAVGDGVLDYKKYIKAGQEVGAKYVLVELDESPNPEEEIAKSVKYIKGILEKQ